MSPSPVVGRLSITSVRHADARDLHADPGLVAAAGEIVLVVGEPVVGHARVALGASPRLTALDVQSGPGQLARDDVATMLRLAAYGVIRDAGGMPLGESPSDAAPPPAVSVLPVRDGPEGIEAFVQHRVATMDFAAGALVFPGGRIDPADRARGEALVLPEGIVEAQERAWRHTAPVPGGARTLLATAVREVAEETGAVLDPRRLLPWDDWITPVGYPRRFDVRFFLYPLDGSGDARAVESGAFGHMTTEAHRSEWLPLARVVAATEREVLQLLPPTRTLVDELSALGTVAAACAVRPSVRPVRHDLAARRPRGLSEHGPTIEGT